MHLYKVQYDLYKVQHVPLGGIACNSTRYSGYLSYFTGRVILIFTITLWLILLIPIGLAHCCAIAIAIEHIRRTAILEQVMDG
jgi:hypothetical protein